MLWIFKPVLALLLKVVASASQLNQIRLRVKWLDVTATYLNQTAALLWQAETSVWPAGECWVYPCASTSPGCGERSAGGHPLHHECAVGLPHLLAHLQHHGRQPVRREVLLLCQHHQRRGLPHQRRQQHDRMPEFDKRQRPLEECQNQLWQRRGRISGFAASGELNLHYEDKNGESIEEEYLWLNSLASSFVTVITEKDFYSVFCSLHGFIYKLTQQQPDQNIY